MSHPARFSKEVIDVMVEILQGCHKMDAAVGHRVTPFHLHDPFAGTGERLWDLAQRIDPPGWISGTEIEAEFIVNKWIRQGDATDASTYPTWPYVIVTSPSYPNGMSDSWDAQDGSKRKTYRSALKQITGVDRELHDHNMGRYGYRGTGQDSPKRAQYWNIASTAVANWGGASMVLVNVSDFIWSRNGVETIEPVTNQWANLLSRHGWVNQTQCPVGTRRMKFGANRDVRVDVECVLVGTRK